MVAFPMAYLAKIFRKKLIYIETFAQISDGTRTGKKMYKKADLIISHGGIGALVAALKLGKKVIAVPRLVKYQEHIDDHQIQVCDKLEKQQYLKVVYEMSDLYGMIQQVKKQKDVKQYSNPSNILSIIDEYIARTQKLLQE